VVVVLTAKLPRKVLKLLISLEERRPAIHSCRKDGHVPHLGSNYNVKALSSNFSLALPKSMGQFVSGFSGGSKDDDWVPAPVDVFLTRLVLSRRLPPELVDVILDHAEYWVPFENERDETLRLEAPADSLYAISQAVEGRKERPVKRIRFKIVSKDQVSLFRDSSHRSM
jgi:hypothetical protein